MGMHTQLQQQTLQIEAGIKVPRPQGQMAGINDPSRNALTENMILDGMAGSVLWELKFGEPGDLAESAGRAVDHLDTYFSRAGFMGTEQCASDPHSNFYLYGWST